MATKRKKRKKHKTIMLDIETNPLKPRGYPWPLPSWPPHCNVCGEELKEPGALLFGPPGGVDHTFTPPGMVGGQCSKDHICKSCFKRLRGWITSSQIIFGAGFALRHHG